MIDLSKRCNLIQGDCLEVLKELPDESIDLVLTDPPYFLINKSGSGFMNKEWDSLNNDWFNNIICKSGSVPFLVDEIAVKCVDKKN